MNSGYPHFHLYTWIEEGAAIMTNAQGGIRLAEERSIAVVYGWPDFKPVVRTAVKVDRSILARYVGTYELTPDLRITFTLEGDQLMTQATDQPKFPVFPESETRFFLTVVDAEVEFVSDDRYRRPGFSPGARKLRTST